MWNLKSKMNETMVESIPCLKGGVGAMTESMSIGTKGLFLSSITAMWQHSL